MGNERSAFVFLSSVVAALALIGANFAIGDERAADASAPGASRHLVVSLGAPLDVSDAGLILADDRNCSNAPALGSIFARVMARSPSASTRFGRV